MPGATLAEIIGDALSAAREFRGAEPCAANLPLLNRFEAALARLDVAISGIPPLALIKQMRDLLSEAIESHIYNDGDDVPVDCPYHQAVKDADAYLAATGPLEPFAIHIDGGLILNVNASDPRLHGLPYLTIDSDIEGLSGADPVTDFPSGTMAYISIGTIESSDIDLSAHASWPTETVESIMAREGW